jgi:hypothetical protein
MFPILWAGFGTLMVRLPGGHRARSLTPLRMICKLLAQELRRLWWFVNPNRPYGCIKMLDEWGDLPVKYFPMAPILAMRKMST